MDLLLLRFATNSYPLWPSIRKFLNDIHLYAGLTCGLIVIAVCLSGTVYVYNTEIREYFDSDRFFVNQQGSPLALEELRSDLEDAYEGKVVGVNVFAQEGRTYQFTLKKPGEENSLTLFVDPYSGKVLADNSSKTSSERWMGYLFSLHRWLLLDKIETPILNQMSNMELGRLINGVATLLFLLGVMTGIFIWVPKKTKNWKQGLGVKWNANWKRINHDLHNSLAFYSLIALFIMSVTGPFWSFGWYKMAWQKSWDIYQAPKEEPKASAPMGDPSESVLVQKEDSVSVYALPIASLDEVIALANRELPYLGNVRITLPEEAGGEIGVSKSRVGFFARAGADQLKITSSSLEIKEVTLFADLPIRQQIGESVKSLHTGEIFGQMTKFLWAVACAIATSLPITGTLIWWNKRKKSKGKNE